MAKDLVNIIGSQPISRYDTRIKGIFALHARVLDEESVNIVSNIYEVQIDTVGLSESFDECLYLSGIEIDVLRLKFGCDDYNLTDKPVRVYYLGEKLIGLEPLEKI